MHWHVLMFFCQIVLIELIWQEKVELGESCIVVTFNTVGFNPSYTYHMRLLYLAIEPLPETQKISHPSPNSDRDRHVCKQINANFIFS